VTASKEIKDFDVFLSNMEHLLTEEYINALEKEVMASVNKKYKDSNKFILDIFIPRLYKGLFRLYNQKSLTEHHIKRADDIHNKIKQLQIDIYEGHKINIMNGYIDKEDTTALNRKANFNNILYTALLDVSKYKIDKERKAFKDKNDSQYTEIDLKIEADKHLLTKMSNLIQSANYAKDELLIAHGQNKILKEVSARINNVIKKSTTSINQLEKQKEEQSQKDDVHNIGNRDSRLTQELPDPQSNDINPILQPFNVEYINDLVASPIQDAVKFNKRKREESQDRSGVNNKQKYNQR